VGIKKITEGGKREGSCEKQNSQKKEKRQEVASKMKGGFGKKERGVKERYKCCYLRGFSLYANWRGKGNPLDPIAQKG